MLEGLGSLFATLTGRIPTDLLSSVTGSWTVQVKKKDDQTPEPDNWFDKLKKGISDQLNSIKNSIMSFLGFGEEEEWIDIAEFDSFISVNGVHDSDIVENAVEHGTFRSVNKIQKPSILSVELAKGGWKAGIENALKNIKIYQGCINNSNDKRKSTILCRIVTPFGIIEDLNLQKIQYSFTRDDGAYLLVCKMDFREIVYYNKAIKNSISNIKSASNTDTKNGGRVALGG